MFFYADTEIEEEKERESFYNFLTQQKRAQEKRVSAAVAEQASAEWRTQQRVFWKFFKPK